MWIWLMVVMETKLKIVSSAIDLFLKNGYGNTSMQEIADGKVRLVEG